MPDTTRSTTPADVISDEPELTLDEVSAACGLTREEIAAFVSEGIAEPRGPAVAWRFSRLTIVQLRKAQRLQHDLGLNPAGVALAFDLMAEIDRLQRRLALFEEES